MTLLVLSLWACGPTPPPPDLVIDAVLHRGAEATPARILLREGRIEAILDPGEALPAGSPAPLVADHVTAGFVDAHGHPDGLGRTLAELDLVGVPTYAATLERARGAAAGDGWLRGRGWDQNDWSDPPEGGWPLATDLEAAVPGRPAALRRVDGHAVWLNQTALAAAGITAATPDPDGGRLIRDASGAPTGVLVDNAMDLVKLPPYTGVEQQQHLDTGLAALQSVGLVGVHAMGLDDAAIARLEAHSGDLPIRVWAYADPGTAAAERLMTSGPWAAGRLRVVGIKAYGDGALGSRGAWLRADYADEPGHRGTPITPPAELERMAVRLASTNASFAVHAIGDAGVGAVLDAFEAADRAHPGNTGTQRVEHAQVVAPDDRARMKAVGAIASMQPTHATSDMPWAPDRLGPDRVAWAYTWRTLLDLGIPLAFGSDHPVESPDPGLGLWAATRRTDLQGNPPGGWTSGEAVALHEAIDGFTRGTWVAVGESAPPLEVRGSPDLTLWDEDEAGRWRAIAVVIEGRARSVGAGR